MCTFKLCVLLFSIFRVCSSTLLFLSSRARHPAGMRGRHWERLSTALGTRVFPGADGELNLQKLLHLGIGSHVELLQASCLAIVISSNVPSSLKA